MRALYVMDPPETLNVSGDSTYALMSEAAARGHSTAWCHPRDLRVLGNEPFAWVQEARALSQAPWFELGERVQVPLGSFDAIWMRKDPPFDMDYVFSTYILDLAQRSGAMVFNDPVALKAANEKMYALQWPELSPPTSVTNSVEEVVALARDHGKVVIKPWDGNGGRGVLITRGNDRNLRSMAELLTQEGRTSILVQPFLEGIKDGDKRIILVDGVPRGWFLRVPGPEDHRGNMHVGATVQPCELDARDREICEALEGRLRAEGLLFVGIDVIGGYLTEINVTSPTGLREIRTLMDRDLASELQDAAEHKLAHR